MKKVVSRLKPDGPRHFIRQWRAHRHLTQEQLAARIGVTHGAISQLERGLISYTQPMLEAIADALQCEASDLIGRPPGAQWGIEQLMSGATDEQRRQLRDIAIALVGPRTGTDG